MLATSPPNDGRLFVVEQHGRIRIFENEQLKPDAVPRHLDTSLVAARRGEQGLLGLAFHPNYASNRQFYVFYTTGNCRTCVARYHASATDPNKADPQRRDPAVDPRLRDEPQRRHDRVRQRRLPLHRHRRRRRRRRSAPQRPGDRSHRSACTNTQCEPLLGKILRIDVNTTADGKHYGIPADNPFAARRRRARDLHASACATRGGGRSIAMTGDMWIGDVGQDVDEELDVLTAGQQAGKNLGWSMYEGNALLRQLHACDRPARRFTQVRSQAHAHADGWLAIIGGQVYRGACFPDLVGTYFFTDNARASARPRDARRTAP